MKTVFKSIISWGLVWLAAGVVSGGAVANLVIQVNHANAKDFTTPQALLSEQFHGSERVTYLRVRLDPSQRARVEGRLGRPLPKPEYTFFVATSRGQIDGYALFDDQLGQHEPISFATFFDATGQITRVEIVAYREPFGDGVRAERFRKQFVGRGAQSQFRTGTDIDIISGATISSRSLCIGVERAAVLFDAAVRGKDPAALALR